MGNLNVVKPPEKAENKFNVAGIGTYTYGDEKPNLAHAEAHAAAVAAAPVSAASLSVPQVYYASRTHSQLSQVIKELKASGYNPKMTILGSREQLCIHPEVSELSGTAQSQACRSKTRKNQCQYFTRLRRAIDGERSIPDVVDIEELVTVNRTRHMCPYYLTRDSDVMRDAELILLPYNYLVDTEMGGSGGGEGGDMSCMCAEHYIYLLFTHEASPPDFMAGRTVPPCHDLAISVLHCAVQPIC